MKFAGLGVEGDAHSGATVKHRSRVERDPSQPNLRQVHLIHAELHDELREKGTHHAYGRPGLAEQLNLQDRGGQAKPYQLRQLMALIRRYDLRIEDDQ